MKLVVVNFLAPYFVLVGLIAGMGGSAPSLSRAFSPPRISGSSSRVAAAAISSMASNDGNDAASPITTPSNNISSSRSNISSRREALRQSLTKTLATIAVTSGSSTLVLPKPAHADVTNKIASSTALRALTRAQGQLSTKLLPEAQKNNFVGIKARLREPPFDTMRKTMLVLVRGGEDGPKATELQVAYKQLIASLETIDATASLGYQGRDIDPFRLGQEYEAIVKALDAFIQVGTEAAGIPLQYAP
mmetsp:Transcript_4666/g.10564  ORF Transcript_4666/g.10564 Transcript_4666/m.10564 type:complete len:247 (+) Transcript_4666:33-773(+)